MLEVALIGGDKVPPLTPPPPPLCCWSPLNLQIAPEAPEMGWTHLHPSWGAAEVTGSTEWNRADALKPNDNNCPRHKIGYSFVFLVKRWKLTSSAQTIQKGQKVSEQLPESSDVFIHLKSTWEKVMKSWSKTGILTSFYCHFSCIKTLSS